MTKNILILALVAGLASPAWTAENNAAPKEESIGVGSGFVAGALAGGPVGAIVGAAMGGWLGDKFHRERSARLDFEHQSEQARLEWEQARLEADELMDRLQSRNADLSQLRSQWRVAQRDYRNALQQALDTQIYFRTGESELDTESSERLSRIAGLIAELGDLTVVVEGHADARGAEDYTSSCHPHARKPCTMRSCWPASRRGGSPRSPKASGILRPMRRISMPWRSIGA